MEDLTTYKNLSDQLYLFCEELKLASHTGTTLTIKIGPQLAQKVLDLMIKGAI